MNTKTTVQSAKRGSNKAMAIKSIVKDNTLGTIDKILKLHKRRLSKKEIVELGFNKNTVYRQVREYEMA